LKPRADSRTLARREFNKLYRNRRLAAEAAGQNFLTYNEAVEQLALQMREQGHVNIEQIDVELLFDRIRLTRECNR
jgi:hypothetical protein